MVSLASADSVARAPCAGCQQTEENWVCLRCFAVGCGRFRHKHGVQHFEDSGHCVAFSYSDFSTWCYACDSYIRNDALSIVHQLAYRSKFGMDPPKRGHATEEEVQEYFDSPEEILRKVKALAQLVRESEHTVAYTGAGISTSAKIPDYRGPQGVWTLRDRGETPKMEVTLDQALPTKGHMALVQLKNEGAVKFLTSTNVDGLHRRSGFGAHEMSELHGYVFPLSLP